MRDSTMARAVLTTACLGLLAAGVPGVAAAEPAAPERYADQQLDWGPCPFDTADGAVPAECATVTVPRDWAAPEAGPDLAVSISRVRADGERQGAMLLNPGGPGGQGSSLAGAIAGLQPDLHHAYDLVGMDPRGTGHEGGTAPDQQGFVCHVPVDRLPQSEGLDARDRSAASIAEHQKTPRAIAEACQSDALAPYITTWQTAHDVDLVRALLGEERLNYLGYSYGTWLGAKYASLFPEHTGKVVLDSNVNWQGRLQAAFEDFPRISQRWFDEVYLPWTTRQLPELVGTDVGSARQAWERAREQYAAQGVSPDAFDSLFVGQGSEFGWLLATAVFVAGLETDQQQPAPDAVPAQLRERLDARSQAGFGVPLAELTPQRVAAAITPDYQDVAGTRAAVACGDQPTKSAEEYRRLSDEQGPELPLFGWAYGLGEVCGPWSDGPRQELPQLPAEVADRVLVVQGEFDPQTGYEQSDAALREAPGVSRVSVDDSPMHGQYATQDNPCVDGMVNVFLLHGSRPDDAVCPSVPLPAEEQVFPVDGPVTSEHTPFAATPGGPDLPDLRAAVQELIGGPSLHPTP